MPGTSAQELEMLELRFCVLSNKALSIAGLVSRYITAFYLGIIKDLNTLSRVQVPNGHGGD